MATARLLASKFTARSGAIAHVRELVLIVGAYFVYMILRQAIAPDIGGVATANAERLISLESKLGFFWESSWHRWAIDTAGWLITLFNWIYIVTFLPIVLTTALIYYLFDRDKYFYYRSIIFLSFGVALIIFSIFPLTPPRMMEHHGFVDTFAIYGPTWYAGREMASYYNAFAAMPSLHFAWTVVFGVLFFRQGSLLFKALGILYPTLTLFAITITANLYILDAIVGAAVMLVSYLIYKMFIQLGLATKVWQFLRYIYLQPRIPLPGQPGLWRRRITGFGHRADSP